MSISYFKKYRDSKLSLELFPFNSNGDVVSCNYYLDKDDNRYRIPNNKSDKVERFYKRNELIAKIPNDFDNVVIDFLYNIQNVDFILADNKPNNREHYGNQFSIFCDGTRVSKVSKLPISKLDVVEYKGNLYLPIFETNLGNVYSDKKGKLYLGKVSTKELKPIQDFKGKQYIIRTIYDVFAKTDSNGDISAKPLINAVLESYNELVDGLGLYNGLLDKADKLSLELYGCGALESKIDISNENIVATVLKKIVEFVKGICKTIYQYWLKFKNFIKQFFIKVQATNKQSIEYVRSLSAEEIEVSQRAFLKNRLLYPNHDKWFSLIGDDGKLIDIKTTVASLSEFVKRLGSLENGGSVRKLINDIRYFEHHRFVFGNKIYQLNPDNLDNPFTAIAVKNIVLPNFTKEELINQLLLDSSIVNHLLYLQDKSSKAVNVFSTEITKIKDESHLEYGKYLQTLSKIYLGVFQMVQDIIQVINAQSYLVSDIHHSTTAKY